MEFFSIFFGIYGPIAITMIVLLVLDAAVPVVAIIGGLIALVAVLIIAKAAWYRICQVMSSRLKKGTKAHLWFENQYLDMRFPSRVRRRHNKLLKQSGS